MNGVTLAARDVEEGVGHRVKRLKTGNAAARDVVSGLKRLKHADLPSEGGSPINDSAAFRKKDKQPSGNGIVGLLSGQDFPLADRGLSLSSNGSMRSAGTQTSEQAPSSFGTTAASPLQLTSDPIDSPDAHADPIDLAIWVAQYIRKIRQEDKSAMEVSARYTRSGPRSSSHIERSLVREPNIKTSARKIDEVTHIRDEPQERGKRWRDPEKGTEHIGPDFETYNPTSDVVQERGNALRRSIKKKAKTLYRTEISAEKTALMGSEAKKRLARLEERATHEAEFKGFTFEPELGHQLFSARGTEGTDDIDAAGTLLINTLQGVRSTFEESSNQEATATLESALRDNQIISKPFSEALRILSANSVIMDAIELGLKSYDENAATDAKARSAIASRATSSADGGDSQRTSRAGGSPCSFLPSSGVRGGAANGCYIGTSHQSNNAIKALNAATVILSDIAEGNSNTYVTPYGNPPQSTVMNNSTSNGLKTQQSIEPNEIEKVNSAKPLTKFQIDALLEFANGGSLMDNDDDESMADAPDEGSRQGDQEASSQPDIDINATLQRILSELAAHEDGGRDNLGFLIATSQADKAAALKRLFSEAGVSINTIIPAAQSYATSQLYAHLSSRAYRFPTSGGINPNHASAYGNTAQMTQRMLARCKTVPQPIQATPSASRGDVIGVPVRGRSPEETRKIREYGFPPLPGSRPGIKREY